MDLGGVKLRVGVEYHQNISYQTLEELIKTITRAGDVAQSVECLPNVLGPQILFLVPHKLYVVAQSQHLGGRSRKIGAPGHHLRRELETR